MELVSLEMILKLTDHLSVAFNFHTVHDLFCKINQKH
jgi:hypothetical protein